MKGILQILIAFLILFSCNKDDVDSSHENEHSTRISAVDISSYPEISNSNPSFFDLDGNQSDFIRILKNNDVNTVRLRLWVNPGNEHCGFNEVKSFSETLKNEGFKIWLTIHYSDTWADPAHQETPTQWQGIGFEQLKDSVYFYTKDIVTQIQPEYIQIGNEINTGFLHPEGHISNEFPKFKQLMDTAIVAVRTHGNDAKIILHFAGIDGAEWFYNQVSVLDYDIIGLSYYPIWHGTSLDDLQSCMQNLSQTHHKDILIAETAYPFTLDWNDWTNNIVGLDEHLILPQYPATPEGQRDFIRAIKTITNEVENGLGFCYWGAELISWNGEQATDGSPWENQALFDFSNRALPVLNEFHCD